MNYVYKVTKENGTIKTMIGQYRVVVGDEMPSGRVIEVIGEYTDGQLGEMIAESIVEKPKKRWGKK